MRTSELPRSTKKPRAHSEKRRLRNAFLLACLIYLPAFVFAWTSVPETPFRAAGTERSMAFTFAQIAAEGALGQASEEPPQEKAQSEPQQETLQPGKPKPKAAAEPTQQAEEGLKAPPEPKPVKKASQATHGKKPTPKKASAQKADAIQEALQKQDMGEAAPESKAQKEAPPLASSSDQEGISTLIYGQRSDPFLSAVRSSIESVLHYPRRVRQLRLTGTVTVQFAVRSDGSLTEVEIFESSGEPLLDNLARKAVYAAQPRWGSPGRALRVRVPVNYELRT